MTAFEEEYKKLNSAQKEAVDALDGPVMVVAGPGTGKTQILALRIANILEKTDIKADGILCLTFTNSAVDAMKNRLGKYIGEAGEKVNVLTFHSFAMLVIEEHYKVLGLREAPKLLEDIDRAIFFEQILADNEWAYLRPRGNSLRYFQDLRSLISLLKRERITAPNFAAAIDKEIKFLEQDEASISTRGESKGKLKKEITEEIESLKRSAEVVKFIELYEERKKEKNLLDYDDILESLVRIVEISEEAASLIRERYLYVLVDEHQDSSRAQNEFLSRVWASVERPDIFVVGDDRQLIYGFSGASIDHFQGFKKTFPDAKLVTLLDNYRSTQVILDASHALLKSVMSDAQLVSQNKEKHPIRLVEAGSPEEEIMAAGLDIQKKIKEEGLNPDDCAILVPKNKQVRTALDILHNMGIPVSTLDTLGLFDQEDARAFLRVLKIIDSGEAVSLALSFLDGISGIEPLSAHAFIASENMREFSFDKLTSRPPALFAQNSSVDAWIGKLIKWKNDFKNVDEQAGLKLFIKKVGEDLLVDTKESKKIVSGREVLDTMLALLDREEEKSPGITLSQFIAYLDKLEAYNEHIPLLTTAAEGVKVLTMHSSKGLEFDYVWIAHMDEKSLSGGKKFGFTLPAGIKERIEERDIDAVKRKLYVAITRAKRFCALSYAALSAKGGGRELARAIADLPPAVFEKQKADVTQKAKISPDMSDVLNLAASKYTDRYVSVSLLNNFFTCPWQWYFRNLLQLPEPRVETFEFGIVVHSSIERILQPARIPRMDEVEDIVAEEVLKRGFGGAADRARMGREALAVVAPWVKNRLPKVSPGRRAEESISVKDDTYPHLKIYGKIDLIENLKGGGLRVTDFKTGSARKKADIEKTDEEGRMSGYLRQLAMYSYLIERSPAWNTNVRESRLEFLEARDPKKAFYDRVIGKKELELLAKDIMDYDALVKEGGWINRPCNYNSYGKGTECEYCARAKIYKN